MSEHILNLSFVSEVEKHPCLYNTKLQEYGLKTVTEKAWKEVGEVFELTAMQAKERWRNLRTVFVRNLRSTAVKRHQYYMADAMKFLIPYVRNAGDNIINTNCSEISYQCSESDQGPVASPETVKVEACDVEDSYFEDERTVSPAISESSYLQTDSISPFHAMEKFCVTPPKQSIPKRKRKSNNVAEQFGEYLKCIMSTTDGTASSNANTMFLLSLLPDLNSMSPAQVRSFKRKVMDLMESVLNENS